MLNEQEQKDLAERIGDMDEKNAEAAKQRLIGFVCGMAAAMTAKTENQGA